MCLLEPGGPVPDDVLPRVEGLVRCRSRPVVVEVQRGPVVDEPDVTVPDQQVGVAPGAVDVLDQRVEPEQLAGEVLVHGPAQRVEPGGAGEEVHGEVEARARPEQILDLLVRLARGDPRVQVGEGELRRPQAERAGQLTRDDLRDERERPLARATELEHVGAEVVGLHETRQAAALPERGQVTGDRDTFKHAGQVRPVAAACSRNGTVGTARPGGGQWSGGRV